MKKVLVLIVLLSAASFSYNSIEAIEDILEKQFELEHSIISDGKNQVSGIDYDLTISQNSAYLGIEVESMFGGSNWEKLNPSSVEEVMIKLATKIREETDNSNLRVTIFVELDQEFGNDKILFNKTY